MFDGLRSRPRNPRRVIKVDVLMQQVLSFDQFEVLNGKAAAVFFLGGRAEVNVVADGGGESATVNAGRVGFSIG